jgi:hypothetical protein
MALVRGGYLRAKTLFGEESGADVEHLGGQGLVGGLGRVRSPPLSRPDLHATAEELLAADPAAPTLPTGIPVPTLSRGSGQKIHFFKRAVQFRTTVKVSAGAAALAAGWAANRNFWPSELTSQ